MIVVVPFVVVLSLTQQIHITKTPHSLLSPLLSAPPLCFLPSPLALILSEVLTGGENLFKQLGHVIDTAVGGSGDSENGSGRFIVKHAKGLTETEGKERE